MRRKRGWFVYLSYSIIGILLAVSAAAFVKGITGAGGGYSDNEAVIVNSKTEAAKDNQSAADNQSASSEYEDVQPCDRKAADTYAGSDDTPDSDDAADSGGTAKSADASDSDDNIAPESPKTADSSSESNEVPLSEKEVSKNEIEISFDEFR